MIYELKKYDSFDSFSKCDKLKFIAWETDEVLDVDNIHVCGKLITYVFDNDNTVNVPDGIETLGYSFLFPYYWHVFDWDSHLCVWYSSVNTVHIPASVTTIKEGAFANTKVSNIIIDPESTCGIIKENGLYTRDGKTLLWILGENTAEEFTYVVPEGVTRIAVDFFSVYNLDEVIIPNSVIEIGYDEKNSYIFEQLIIKAPKGSYAIEFAKEHNIYYEEVE